MEKVKGEMAYAIIILEAEEVLVPSKHISELTVDFSMPFQYRNAAYFGAEYFFEHYNLYRSREGHIDLHISFWDVHDMPGDTSAGIITYATVMALLQAFEFKIEGFSLNKENGVLHMPLR